jgi:adenylosuccinate lyase
MDPTWIQTVGLPTAALVAIGYGGWSTSQWIAQHLIIPIRDRHFEFLHSLSQTLETIATTQEHMAREITELARSNTEISRMNGAKQ